MSWRVYDGGEGRMNIMGYTANAAIVSVNTYPSGTLFKQSPLARVRTGGQDNSQFCECELKVNILVTLFG